MVEQSPAQASLTQKLESFAAGLSDEEREIFGRLLSHAVDMSPNTDEIQGYALFDATPALFRSVGGGSGVEGTQIKLGLLRPGSVGVLAGRSAR